MNIEKTFQREKDEINYKSFTSCHLRELIVYWEETPPTFQVLPVSRLGISDECESGERRAAQSSILLPTPSHHQQHLIDCNTIRVKQQVRNGQINKVLKV